MKFLAQSNELSEVDELKRLQAESRRGLHPTLNAMLSAILDRAFKGEL
jgi:hypothetical protein